MNDFGRRLAIAESEIDSQLWFNYGWLGLSA